MITCAAVSLLYIILYYTRHRLSEFVNCHKLKLYVCIYIIYFIKLLIILYEYAYIYWQTCGKYCTSHNIHAYYIMYRRRPYRFFVRVRVCITYIRIPTGSKFFFRRPFAAAAAVVSLKSK